jgi:hypothetical protein
MVQKNLDAQNFCLLQQKPSWRLPQKDNVFLIYVLTLSHIHMKFLFNTKNSRMCLRREMQAPCPNINHMTAPLILWKERNLHLDPSIFCRKTNLQHLVNTSKKTSKKGSFNIQSLQLVPLSFLSKGRVIFLCVDYCRLNRLTIKN